MPVIKNRTVLGLRKNLSGFLNLDAGLIRGAVPDHERMLKEAHDAAAKRKRQLHQAREQLTDKHRQLTQSQERLSEKGAQLLRSQRSLSRKEEELHKVQRQLADERQVRERLSERDRELQERLLEKDQQLAALRTNVEPFKGEPLDEELHAGIARVLDRIPIDLGGGCSLDKAYLIATLIRRYDLKRTLDIGVYRGRSLFPQALAHTVFTGGVAYGVDPYSAAEAREEDIGPADRKNKDDINRFVEQTDWQAICRAVVSMRDELGYGDHCVLVRETSAAAVPYFEKIGVTFGMVHIDGNHDTDKTMEDLELYLPRVEKDGFIVLDDVSFRSIRPAYEKLKANTTLVYERTDENNANDFAVFKNVPPLPNAVHNLRLWTRDF